MDETVLFPSPNWFSNSNLAVSTDGWLIYGGPNRSICVLEPLRQENLVISGNQSYQAHVTTRAHQEKVSCVDLSPEFTVKRTFLSGGDDGVVKEWILDKVKDKFKIKSLHSHKTHYNENENITGVGYSTENVAISVGSLGHIVKWDLIANVCNTYSKCTQHFKINCMACSPHLPLHVAVGTKQGVIFVIDLSGTTEKLIYKVRGQDDEILHMKWCPQYEVLLNKGIDELPKKSTADKRLPAIKNGVEENLEQSGTSQALPEVSSVETVVDSNGKPTSNEKVGKESTNSHELECSGSSKTLSGDNSVEAVVDCNSKPTSNEKVGKVSTNSHDIVSKTISDSSVEAVVDSNSKPTSNEKIEKEPKNSHELECSVVSKSLPEDSFDETVVEEDDTFDIYKDHEKSEFGHKKYEPEDILVKKKDEKSEECDYLSECLKLKEDILKRKNGEEQTIESLVEAMAKAHVSPSTSDVSYSTAVQNHSICDSDKNINVGVSVHPHKHLLATISKYGAVRIWSKSGKQVGACTVPYIIKNAKSKNNGWPSLLWYTPDKLLLVDARSQLLECNPLQIDSKNMITWRVVHSLHKRGLYAIASDAPKVHTAYDSLESPYYIDREKWSIYTVAQDRYIIQYSLTSNKALAIHNTCGGFLYNVQPCPYDAGKFAISVGDGAVRVWRSTTETDDENKLCPSVVQTYWQNVQGKVLSVAWHPTRENLLAFGTGESRVGILDTGGKTEKSARTLTPAVNGAIYSICWGEDMQLYVCGGGDFVMYDASRPTEAPTPVEVMVEGERWSISSLNWSARGMLVGSQLGAIAVLDPVNYSVQTFAFLFTKVIHGLEWHPVQTSNSSEESPYKNFIAVCSQDKCHNIIISEYKNKDDGGNELIVWKTLSGHTLPVLQLAWSPHAEELLLSTSQDYTVRVWNVVSGTCISVFGNHSLHTLGATWLSMPQFDTKIMSGGGDCCLRLWDYNDHKPEQYEKIKPDNGTKKKAEKKETNNKRINNVSNSEEVQTPQADGAPNPSPKFLFPSLHKEINPCKFPAVWKMYQKFFNGNATEENNCDKSDSYDVNFIKIFGNTNEINELLDKEMNSMLENHTLEPWLIMSLFRGNIDAMMQLATERDMLSPFLLSVAPCVSFKYWKDATQLYIAQIDRMIARKDTGKLCDKKYYGGAVYRKVAALLAIHDVKGAVSTLADNKLFKEAYILCRIRYMDSIAQETLKQWAQYSYFSGNVRLSVICYMALGELSEAATLLAKCPDRESLALAADLAKLAGRNTFADHMEKKAQTTVKTAKEISEDMLQLPSRVALLLEDVENDHKMLSKSDNLNGDADVE